MRGIFHSKEWWAASLFVLFPGLIEIIAQSADGTAKLLLWIYVDVVRKWVLWEFLHFGYCLVLKRYQMSVSAQFGSVGVEYHFKWLNIQDPIPWGMNSWGADNATHLLCQLSLSAFGLLLLCKQAATSFIRPTMFGCYIPYARTKMYLAEVCVASFYSLYLLFFHFIRSGCCPTHW